MKSIVFAAVLILTRTVCFGQDDPEPVRNCNPSTKIDEFKYTTLNDAKDRIELFGLQIKNSGAFGVVIGYGGLNTESNQGRMLASEVEQFLTAKFNFAPYSTIRSRHGGHREEATVELYIKPSSCSSDPEPSPSLGFDEVRYKEEEGLFEKAMIRKSASELRSLLTDEIQVPYPPAARAVRAAGMVIVLVLVDEKGRVSKAVAVDGHPLLRAAAESAVRNTAFQKLLAGDTAVRYGGKIEIDFDRLLTLHEQ